MPETFDKDAKFLLGEISAIVRELPARMDRMERKLDARDDALGATDRELEVRLREVEKGQTSHGTLWSVLAAIATSGISGFAVHFFLK